MIYILYSGDYEVYLGGNHQPESEILIEPTRQAMDVFDSIGAPVTLFADLLCLWRYRDLGHHDFPDAVDVQLKDIIRRGHDVQMHLHPHWPNTKIELREDGTSYYQVDREWLYLGSHIPDIYKFMYDHLKSGREYLNELLKKVDTNYQCIAYRAGAYGIMPGHKEIFSALKDTGYLIDSSVVPGYPGKEVRRDQIVSFHDVPDLGNYYLSAESGLTKPADKGLFEIPVAALVLSDPISTFLIKIRRIKSIFKNKSKPHLRLGLTLNDSFRLRCSGTAKVPIKRSLLGFLRRSLSLSHWRMMDLSEDTDFMLRITNEYIKKHRCDSEDLFFSVSFHPKDFFPEKQKALISYHNGLKKQYGAEIKAISFREAATLISSSPEVANR